jgi:triacylglycerol lipase
MHAGDSAAFAAILLLLLIVIAFVARRFVLRRPRPPLVRARRSARLGPIAPPPAAAEPAPAPDAALPATRQSVPPALDAPEIAASPEPIEERAPPPEPPEANREAPRPPAPLAIWVERPLVWIPPPRRGKTRHPVLLAHGFAGFDAVEIRGLRLAYFRGVADRLRSAGVEVHVLRVSPIASIVQRARQLTEQVRRLPAERYNIVAHSMGGLDARYALTALGLGDRIASLTTISTPHRGTPLADLGVSLFGGALGRLGVPLDAFRDLTTERMEAFNQEAHDAPGVVYGCFVASARQVNAMLVPAHRFLHRRAGDNDGIVPASSQRWGEVLGEIDVDHWGAVGWSSRFDAGTFYERLALDLGARGL